MQARIKMTLGIQAAYRKSDSNDKSILLTLRAKKRFSREKQSSAIGKIKRKNLEPNCCSDNEREYHNGTCGGPKKNKAVQIASSKREDPTDSSENRLGFINVKT